MFTYIFRIGKFVFRMTVMDFGEPNGEGVAIHPNEARLDDPEYLAALRQAVEGFPLFEKWSFVHHRMPQPYKKLFDDELKSLLVACEEILNQDVLPFPEELLDVTREEHAALKAECDRREKKRKATQRRLEPKPGYVYLLYSSLGYYKIGQTINPGRRLKDFGVKLPFDIECICLIETKECHQLEADLQKRFADKRINGEWFLLEPDDVKYIVSLARGRL